MKWKRQYGTIRRVIPVQWFAGIYEMEWTMAKLEELTEKFKFATFRATTEVNVQGNQVIRAHWLGHEFDVMYWPNGLDGTSGQAVWHVESLPFGKKEFDEKILTQVPDHPDFKSFIANDYGDIVSTFDYIFSMFRCIHAQGLHRKVEE